MNGLRVMFTCTQYVKFNNTISPTLSVTSGISQGTIRGPLIFIFYIYDVLRNVDNLRVNMYADNCLIYCIGNNWELMRPKIQNGLNSFQIWCLKNRLKLNVRKSKSLIIGSSYKLGDIDMDNKMVLNGEVLDFTEV